MFATVGTTLAGLRGLPYVRIAIIGAAMALMAFAGGAPTDWGCC